MRKNIERQGDYRVRNDGDNKGQKVLLVRDAEITETPCNDILVRKELLH